MKQRLALIVALLSTSLTSPALGASVVASGGATICDQTVGSSTNVSAYQVAGGDCVIEFKNVGSTTWTVPAGITSITYLVVAGGGGGAGGQASEHGGGGGGAGGFLNGTTTVSSGNISIVVGSGGTAGAANNVGTAGGNSSFAGTVTAIGGGRGGTYFTYGATIGGSGGGAGAGNFTTGANGTGGQGTRGGNVTATTTNGRHGGGGGGASAAGGNTVSSGSLTVSAGGGGAGASSSITGTNTYYAGGGGGGGSSASGGSGGAAGGAGGGGSGATYDGTSLTAATAGGTNTGGGGGGGSGIGGAGASAGAAGGSGIVIIRYTPGPVNTALPSITGVVEYSETLTASTGTWSYSPTSYTYQWSRSATSGGSYTNIAGANSSTYSPVAADIAQFLKVTVTASNSNGSVAATSVATSQVSRGVELPALTIPAGDFIYRSAKTLSVTSTIAGKVTFKANREVITKCKNLSLNAGNSYTKTCVYKPSIHAGIVITVIFTPTDTNYDGATIVSNQYYVKSRSTTR